MARANENANAQGDRALNLIFMAFNLSDANSADCPPDKNVIPGTAAGTTRMRHFTVASAISIVVPTTALPADGSSYTSPALAGVGILGILSWVLF